MVSIHLAIILNVDVLTAEHIEILDVAERVYGSAPNVRELQHCAWQVENVAVNAGLYGIRWN